MTQAERQFVARLTRRALALSPDLARRELEAYRLIAATLNDRELVAAIRSGQVDRLIMELLSDERMDPALLRLRNKLDLALLDSTRAEALRGLPSLYAPQVFSVLNPIVIEAANRVGLKYVDTLKNEVRATVRQAITEGLKEGVSPSTVARGIRGVIGLAPNQEEAIRNFNEDLHWLHLSVEEMEARGITYPWTRALRDKRFDRTLRRVRAERGHLPPELIAKMTDRYRRGVIANTAETHARTLALDTQKLAQRLAWDDAIARRIVNPDDLVRTWVTVGDERVRPEHVELNGTRVGYDQPFPNGEMTPGESTYNCRCQAHVTLATSARRVAA